MRIRIREQSPGDVPPDILAYKIYSPLTRLSIDRGHEIFIAATLYKILKVNTVTAVCISARSNLPFLFLQFALVVDPVPSGLSVRKSVKGIVSNEGGRRKERNEREEKKREKGREETRSNNNACSSRDKSGRYEIAILQLIPRNDEMEIVSRESFPLLNI